MLATQSPRKTFALTSEKSRMFGQKLPLKPKEVWSIRVRLQLDKSCLVQSGHRQQASKLRSRHPAGSRVSQTGRVKERAIVLQQKTGRPVQFELTEQTRETLQDWISEKGLCDNGLPVSQPSAR